MNQLTEKEVAVSEVIIKDQEIMIQNLQGQIKDNRRIIINQDVVIRNLKKKVEKYKILLKEAFKDENFRLFMCNLFEDSGHNKWVDFCKEYCPNNNSNTECVDCFLLECDELEPRCEMCPHNDNCEDERNNRGAI